MFRPGAEGPRCHGPVALHIASDLEVVAGQTRDTVDLDNAACGRVGHRGLHVADRQAAHEPKAMSNVSNALVLVTAVPNRRETNLSSVPRSFGRATVTGAVVVLTVVEQNPF